MFKFGQILLPGMPLWLPFEQAPHCFHQEHTHVFVALPID